MDTDRIVGSAKDAAGKVKDAAGKVEGAVGDMAGNAQTQAAGHAREAAGMVQNLYGQAKDTARDAGDAAISYAKDAYQNSGETLRDGSQAVAKAMQDNPLGAPPRNPTLDSHVETPAGVRDGSAGFAARNCGTIFLSSHCRSAILQWRRTL